MSLTDEEKNAITFKRAYEIADLVFSQRFEGNP